jgi:hypothetical protein
VAEFRPKIVRRNSEVTFCEDGATKWVEKRYFSQYCVEDEILAYEALLSLVEGLPKIQLPIVQIKDGVNDVILMEYIPGLTLAESLDSPDDGFSLAISSSLLEVFLRSKDQSIVFDSDPSNILVVQGNAVLIDPVFQPMQEEDINLVIFLVGLIKLIAKKPTIRRFSKISQVWRRYYYDYAVLSGVSPSSINGQIGSYCATVIGWNLERSEAESWLKYFFRVVVFVPFWLSLKVAFENNIIGGQEHRGA